MQPETPRSLFAHKALTASGWQRDVRISIDAQGNIATVEANAKADGAPSFDLVLPGMANVHSHAFQRAMAGLTETASGKTDDNFWSWREVMYAFTRRLTPEHMEVIARALYIELLKNGYTSVGEFHYLHHDANGKPYGSVTEMSDRVIAAALAAGIHITHLPVLYQTGNFGGVAASDAQKRFVQTTEDYLKLLEALTKRYQGNTDVTLGVAPHSLRALAPGALQAVMEALPGLGMGDCPVHIHVAEQEKEVADCIAWSKQRPVEWLLGNAKVDARWCLVHATHVTPDELKCLVASGAVAGLCPTTEANLGDGIFPAEAYLRAGGGWGIGSDSNVCMSPWEELRLLEYGQRLSARRRTVLCDVATPSVGRTLFGQAATGGAQALGLGSGRITPGLRADLVALSMEDALLADKEGDAILDTLLFATPPRIVAVLVAGKRVVQNGIHALEEESARDLRKVMKELRA